MNEEDKLLYQNFEKTNNCINKKTNKKFMLLSMFGYEIKEDSTM